MAGESSDHGLRQATPPSLGNERPSEVVHPNALEPSRHACPLHGALDVLPGLARPWVHEHEVDSESANLLGYPYTLQAAIAGCHARARRAEETDWKRIVALYDALVELTQSPVVGLNRAVSMAFGPAAGVELVDALADEQR